MTNILQDGAAWLGGKLKDHASLTLTYQRGTASVAIVGTATMHRYEVLNEEGFGLTFLSRDYLVHAADLVLGGAEIAPQAGDRITETIRGVVQQFEVMPLGEQAPYEPLDTDGLLIVIHSKRVV